MQLTDFDALSFDCYGTLIDWETGLAAVLAPLGAASGNWTIDDEALLAAYSAARGAGRARVPGRAVPGDPGPQHAGAGRRVRRGGHRRRRAAARRSVPDWPAFPDSPRALATLARGYKLIILSNVDRASFAGSNRRLGVDVRQRPHRAGHRLLQAVDPATSTRCSPRPPGSASARAGCCTLRRACTTTTSRPSGPGCRRSGSTGATTGPGWGATPAPPAESCRTGSSPRLQAFAEAAVH